MYVGAHPSTNSVHVMVPGQSVAGAVSSVIDVYLCTYCGYYEQYLAEPAALSFAATYWGQVEPTT